MKKIIIGFSMLFLVIPSIAFASQKTNVTLKSETYNDGLISRIYQIDSKNQLIKDIQVPDSFLQQVNESSNPLLEAKMLMTTADMELGLKERLAELNGQYVDGLGEVNVSVDPSLQATFNEQKNEAMKYANAQLSEWNTLSSDNKKATYDTSNILFKDYSQLNLGHVYTQKELNQYYAAMKSGSMQPAKKAAGINSNTHSTLYVISGVAILLILIGLITAVLRKRR